MLIGARNAMLAGGAALPYDKQVEYLRSDGYAYVDADIWFDGVDNFEIVSDFKFNRTSRNIGVFGFYYSPQRADAHAAMCRPFYRGASYQSTVQLCSYNSPTAGNIYLPQADTFLSRHTVKLNREGIFIDGDLAANGGVVSGVGLVNRSSTRQAPFLIFCSSSNSQTYGNTFAKEQQGGVRYVYNFSARINGVLVRDFIPVRVGTIGYLYDRVSGQLFGNAGTGAFVIGPDAAAANGGGYKRQCVRRSYRRSWRPSTRFCSPRLWKEVA